MALLLLPASGGAQRLASEFARLSDPWSEAPASRSAVIVFGHPDDHRWEGAIVGGTFVGLQVGLGTAAALCSGDSAGTASDCLGYGFLGFLIGGTVGGLLGGLIGSAMPKEKAAKPE